MVWIGDSTVGLGVRMAGVSLYKRSGINVPSRLSDALFSELAGGGGGPDQLLADLASKGDRRGDVLE